jgi:acyl-CoA synthetase (AMP-forming)/AMP-acid ligase II
MSGYWNRSGYDTSNYDDCGWMLTNDLGYIDPQNGKLYFRGRADDVIRTGGESVLASDVERVIVDYFAENDEDHAFVECAVFPLPDEKFGEAVCAAVVLAPLISSAVSMSSSSSEVSRRADVGLAAINSNTGSCNECNDMIMVNENEEMMLKIRRYFAERQIAGYKRPRRVFRMRHALPRNASGKVWKHAVIRLCAEAMAKETSRL